MIFKISNSHPLTFLDTKKYLSDWCENISFIKLNNSEYQKNLNFLSTAPFVLEKVIETRGRHGCSFNGKNYPTEDVLIKDVSGAGDTFISCLAIEYCKSNDIVLAIPSSGLHSNGFSLVRNILKKKLTIPKNIKNELIRPTKIYVKEVNLINKKKLINGCANITGGGLLNNVIRSVPEKLSLNINL